MKTITSCFLSIVVLVVVCSYQMVCMAVNIHIGEGVWAVFNAVVIAICVFGIYLAYKQAKSYEDAIRHAIADLFMRQQICDLKDFLESIKPEPQPENKPEDEVEADNGTPV